MAKKVQGLYFGIPAASSHCTELPTSLNKQFYAQLEICAVDYRTDITIWVAKSFSKEYAFVYEVDSKTRLPF